MPSKNILLIDDDKEFLNLFSAIIKNAGYDIDVASNGREALDKFEKLKFDLLILDINLPDMMGGELAIKIREKDKEIKFIVVTGYPDLQESIETIDIGIQDILLKPISSSEMLKAIKEAFVS